MENLTISVLSGSSLVLFRSTQCSVWFVIIVDKAVWINKYKMTINQHLNFQKW